MDGVTMGESTHSLQYKRGGTVYNIKTYTSTSDVGPNYITLKIAGDLVYAKLGSIASVDASHLRAMKGGVTYSVLVTAVAYNNIDWTLASTANPLSFENEISGFLSNWVSTDWDNAPSVDTSLSTLSGFSAITPVSPDMTHSTSFYLASITYTPVNYSAYGSVLMPNGKVLVVPLHHAKCGIFDPSTNILSEGPSYPVTTSGAFVGGVLLPNGKVLLVPNNHPNIVFYNPSTNECELGPAHGRGASAFYGATLIADGRVILSPWNSTYIGIYDYSNNTYTNGPAHGRGSAAFSGAVALPNNKVLLPCFNAGYLGLYDIATNTYSNGPFVGRQHLGGGAITSNNKVVLAASYTNPYIGIYDIDTNTHEVGTSHGQATYPFFGAKTLPNGNVVLIPHFSASIIVYNPVTNTIVDSIAHGQGTEVFSNGVVMPNGKVLLPPTRDKVGVYDPMITNQVGIANCLHPMLNKF